MNKSFYRIYQLPHNHKNIFEPYGFARGTIDLGDYCCVWASEFVSTSKSDFDMCEDLFYTFNMDHPAGFGGHSMSVSDIVEIHRETGVKRYYCDSLGFKEINIQGVHTVYFVI